MNWKLKISKFSKITRWKHWSESKLSFAVLVTISFSSISNSSPLICFSLILYIMCHLCFGYTFNDWCDKEVDSKVGKPNPSDYLKSWQQLTTPILCLVITFLMFTIIPLKFSTKVLMVVGIILGIFYSGAGVRFKEKGLWGILLGGFAQWTIPVLVILTEFGYWKLTWCLIPISLLMGIRWMLIHQFLDIQNDLRSSVKTWATNNSGEEILHLINLTYYMECFFFWVLFCLTLIDGLFVAAFFILIAFLLSKLGEFFDRQKNWDNNFANVRNTSLYFFWLPIFIYPTALIQNNLLLIGVVFHFVITRTFIIGETQRLYFEIFKEKFNGPISAKTPSGFRDS